MPVLEDSRELISPTMNPTSPERPRSDSAETKHWKDWPNAAAVSVSVVLTGLCMPMT